jgi:LysM repeat protein
MSLAVSAYRWLIVMGLALVCAGCLEEPGSDQDELMDPHVVQGKNLAKSLDFQGAVEAYDKALEVNPANAVAHFELFWLHEQKVIDYPAAIYHGERYLKLRPNASNAELVRQRILGCKQELVKSLPMGPITPALQRDFERLTAENRLLRQRIEQLTQQVAFLSTNRVYAAQSATNAGPGSVSNPAFEPPRMPATPALTVRSMSVSAVNPAKPYKIHTVQSGETLAKIARKYNVRLPTLMNANPKLDARKIKVGQTVNIPQ